jgi:glyoxylase-like metal-dependent hydrolase (beta-lactamase superfamily II)
MIVKTLMVGPLQTGCYLVLDGKDGPGAIIDPGGDADRILDAAEDIEIRYVINTHGHFDHIAANAEVMRVLSERQQSPPQLVAHEKALPLLAENGGAAFFGLHVPPSPEPDRLVDEGDVLTLGRSRLVVMHTPGHSPGSISLYCADEKLIFVGDVLFQQGIGRTDLPGGSWMTLMDSIKDKLLVLPDDTVVYPGHGLSTTIGAERRGNPFLG